jgi:hypothetical protein
MKIGNQMFLKRPWLFTIYTIIGGGLFLYFGGPQTQNAAVVVVAAGVVTVINIWFFVSLKQTLRDQKRTQTLK